MPELPAGGSGSGSGAGLLPTPLASLGTNGGPNQRDSSGRPGLQMAAMIWPTPRNNTGPSLDARHLSLDGAVRLWTTPSATDGSRGGVITPNMSGSSLPQQVNTPERWPTPCAMEPVKNAAKHQAKLALPRAQRGGGNGLNLASAVNLFPTPTVHGNNNRKGLSAKSGDGLATAVKMLPTPTAQDAKQVDPPCHRNGRRKAPCLGTVVNVEAESVGGLLNPTWVEWLMGWPLGWTDCGASATARFQQWCALHSKPSQGPDA